MKDADCVAFLQWALPRLHMRWPGFRRVRRQVCRRIQRRLAAVSCAGIDDYRAFILAQPAEWSVLDGLCRVTVTRFYRDRQVFAVLVRDVLPALAAAAQARGADRLRVWSAGCASGEEPYTLAIAWALQLARHFPRLGIDILATDADSGLLARGEQARYGWSAVKNLPADWRAAAFEADADEYCLKPAFRAAVRFQVQDIRVPFRQTGFDLILCRNLAFTYYEPSLQVDITGMLYERLLPGGVLVLGVHEQLPEAGPRFDALSERLSLYRRPASASRTGI